MESMRAIPYSVILANYNSLENTETSKMWMAVRNSNSKYGQLLNRIGSDNNLNNRKFVNDLLTLLLQFEDQEYLSNIIFSPELQDIDVNRIKEAFNLYLNDGCSFNVVDADSIFGKAALELSLENTRCKRDTLKTFYENNFPATLEHHSHLEIQKCFDKAKLITASAKNILSTVSSLLQIPYSRSTTVKLSAWKKMFDGVQHKDNANPIVPAQKKGNRGRKRNSQTMINAGGKAQRSAEIEHSIRNSNAETENCDAVEILNDEDMSLQMQQELEKFTKTFYEEIHQIPCTSCFVCRRLQITSNLKTITVGNQFQQLISSFGVNIETGISVSVCLRCHGFVGKSRPQFPAQAHFNSLTLPPIPSTISCLTSPEIQMISQVRPFMKIFHLCKGQGQAALKGSVIHFPNSVDQICDKLPTISSLADFVVVNETMDDIAKAKELTIRPERLHEALIWLKENNHLYRNIAISELAASDVELPNVSHSSTPQLNNVLPNETEVIEATFNDIGNSRRILRASFHQGSPSHFDSRSRGIQCTAMAMTAIATSIIQAPNTWRTSTLDSILRRGNELFLEKSPELQLLTAIESSGRIANVMAGLTVITTAHEELSLNGQLNKMLQNIEGDPTFASANLQTRLTEFIQGNFENAILTVGDYSMGLIKMEAHLYLFDSHSRGEKGGVAADGFAFLMEISSDVAALQISKIIHRNLEPRIYNSSASEMDNRFFIFNIVPITAHNDLGEPANNIEVQEEELILHENAPIENTPSVRMTSIGNSAITFGDNGLSDTVFHTVDHRIPTLQSVRESIQQERVNLHRERGRPLYANQETHLEELSFPQIFPHGSGGLSAVRRIQITPLDYFQARVMSADTRFWDNSYLFYALSRMEDYKVKSKIAICAQMLQGDAGNAANNQEYPGLRNVHLYMSSIRGSASYWKKYTGDLISMIKQIGIPSIFLTISSDDLNSTDSLAGLICAQAMRQNSDQSLCNQVKDLLKQKKYEDIHQAVKMLTYDQKSSLLNNHPVQAARQFSHRVKAFIKFLKKASKQLFGYPLQDYSYRIEFQNRGSGHLHMLIWLNGAPTNFHSAEGLKFIDHNLKCCIPNDGEKELKEFVLKYQSHSHKSTCFKNGNKFCRFDFPRKVSEVTKVLDEDDTARNKGRFIMLKRNPEETFINNYHPLLLKIMKCNMDIQVVTDANAVAYYIAKYISKAEPSEVQNEIQNIMKDMQSNPRASYYDSALKIASKIMNHRQVGAPEAAFRLCHLDLRRSSRGFVFIPAYQPSKRLHLVHKETVGRENVTIGKSLIEKYMLRPVALQQICLYEFAAFYRPKHRDAEIANCAEDDSSDEEDDPVVAREIKLTNGTRMVLRKTSAVVKYPNFDIIKEKEDYYYCMLLLYLPFQTENFIDGYDNIFHAFRGKSAQFRKTTDCDILRADLAQEIDKALLRIVDWRNDDSELNENDQNWPEEQLIEVDEALPDPTELFQPNAPIYDLMGRYRSLSNEQREVFNMVRDKLDTPSLPQILSYISGAGGVGKSYLIDSISALVSAYEAATRPNTLLRAAPTGISALNINATTIHRAFKLPIQRGFIPSYTPLSSKQVEEMRTALRNVEFIIIDEISMVAYQYFRIIHLRLQEIFSPDEPFGGKNMLVFGDLMQFKPVQGSWIFEVPTSLSHEMHLWRQFRFFELHINHRQTGDTTFLDLLNRLRFGCCTSKDFKMLESRIFNSDSLEDREKCTHFTDALALYPERESVRLYNAEKTEELRKSNPNIYKIKAVDTFADGNQYDQPCPDSLLPKNDRFSAGIPTEIELGVGSRVMLRRNLSLIDGLVNGSVGTVKEIRWTALRREQLKEGDLPESVLIHFDGEMGGRRKDSNGYVKIECASFEFVGLRQTLIKRRMLPIVLCWALNFHKTQGLTLHFASIDLSKKHFAKAMSYVALSRVKTLEGLRIINIKENNIVAVKPDKPPCDDNAVREIYRLRLSKIDFTESRELQEMLDWVLEYSICTTCKKWVCLCTCI